MKSYASKEELKAEIEKTYQKYIAEFDDIPEKLKDKRSEAVDRTPAENLAYQVGWTNLLLEWEAKEQKGEEFHTPTDEFKWNELNKLYQWFNETYAHNSLEQLKQMLDSNINQLYQMIDAMSEDELFKPHMREWADKSTKSAVWEAYKFIHINTVSPFGTFRTKIRKWKKNEL